MVNRTKHAFYVGERSPDDKRKIRLSGYILEPKHPKGTVYFLQGFSGRYEAYTDPFLSSIAEEFRVITYNHRGHNGSGGRFDAKRGIADWEEIIENNKEPAFLLAHSCGAGLALGIDSGKVKKAYLLEPVLSSRMLPLWMHLGVNILKYAYVLPGLLSELDRYLEVYDVPQKVDLPVQNLAQNLVGIACLEPKKYSKPLAFTISDKDPALDTVSKRHRRVALVERFMNMYPQANNKSNLVDGLNHCLNLEENVPFLRKEDGKDSERIIEDIIDFYMKC